jgi:hypothetical protein
VCVDRLKEEQPEWWSWSWPSRSLMEALLTGSDGRGRGARCKVWRCSEVGDAVAAWSVVLLAAGCAPHSEIGFRVCRWEERLR